MMRTRAALLLVVALATPIRSDDAKDSDGIQGAWKVAELIVVGKSLDRVKDEITTVIRNDKINSSILATSRTPPTSSTWCWIRP